MRLSWTAFTELLRCTLLGHLRNRLALALAVAFIPLWIAVARLCTSDATVRVWLAAISASASAPASQVGQVASALGAVTMVVGFITFTETFQSRQMDRRLLLAGYPRLPMLLAKLAAVALTAALLAFYTTMLLWISLPVRHAGPLGLALAGAGLAYGGIGLLLGSLVRGELEGFFLIIMLSLVDTGLQNPVFNTLMDVAGVSALPLYGVNQLALSSALTPHIPWSHGLLSFTWSATTGALALLVLHTHRPFRSPWSHRTRSKAEDLRIGSPGAHEGRTFPDV